MAHNTTSASAVAARVTTLSFMRSLRLTVEAPFYYEDTLRGAFHARRDATRRRQDGLGGGRSRRHAANDRANAGGRRVCRSNGFERCRGTRVARHGEQRDRSRAFRRHDARDERDRFVVSHSRAVSRRAGGDRLRRRERAGTDRKSTRLNSSHVEISYAVFCLKKKKEQNK